MEETLCPLECVNAACNKDFLKDHGAWVLTVVAGFMTCLGMLLSYFLRSRCRKIQLCGVPCCDRDVVDLRPEDVNISSNTSV